MFILSEYTYQTFSTENVKVKHMIISIAVIVTIVNNVSEQKLYDYLLLYLQCRNKQWM